jgi:hypothetical protein
VENRIQPRLQIRPRREPVGKPERLDERILNEVLGIGPVPGQPQRRRVQRLQEAQGLSGERFLIVGRDAAEHWQRGQYPEP